MVFLSPPAVEPLFRVSAMASRTFTPVPCWSQAGHEVRSQKSGPPPVVRSAVPHTRFFGLVSQGPGGRKMPAMADGHVAQRETKEAASNRSSNRRNLEHVPHDHDNCGGKRSQGIQVSAQND